MTLACIGIPGSGKSRYLGRLAAWKLRDRHARIFCYCPHRPEHPDDPLRRGAWLVGSQLDAPRDRLPRLTIASRPEDTDRLIEAAIRCRPCVLWMDEITDATRKQSFTSEPFRRVWATFRHEGISLWIALHKHQDCPTVMLDHAHAHLVFPLARSTANDRYLDGRYGEAARVAIRALPCPTWRPVIAVLRPTPELDRLGIRAHTPKQNPPEVPPGTTKPRPKE